ncbi:MAG: hypothetical protein KG003_03375 [Bacteroidetes bacterium]|nr:hypothetical protein [Bacteroidota bacterium]
MKQKLKYGLWICALAIASAANAQDGPPPGDSTRKAKMEELKKTRRELFIKKLSLTDEESKKFFPIYDEYQLKLRTERRAFKDKWKGKKPEDLTEEEANVYLKDAIDLRSKELELFKTYSEKLKTVIPVKKVVMLPRVEKEIQHELIGKARDGKGPGGKRKGPPRGGQHGPPPPPPPEGE